MAPLPIRDEVFTAEVMQAPEPVLVYVWADWCGPCRLMTQILTQMAPAWQGRLKMVKMHADENPLTVKQYQVEGIPTLLLFRGGELLWNHEGVLNQAKLQQALTQYLAV
ncbi:thioredoxin domain-containing protein [Gloeomargarita lithophora Alchichica-D10]|uniref:Thioredoxin n=1 Tax=Gloeomargarita lithophora Alchichica-D10 TaxID=1188229 RepID=A0A1J0AEM1_9CYAN|nr:thioredoxin domain-containing protein [Gloeomargarita lithophora]APB34398.1 thioredoxin domain-containing protein [Gloeomargarita lithophora Alchichica-D10]